MEENRPLRQHVQPADLKKLLDTVLQAPSKCHKAIRPSKALNGNVTSNLDLHSSLLSK